MQLEKNDIIATFNSYIRDRMDFLADLSTATPLMEVTKLLLGEVISGLDRNRIQMNYISGVEKFRYSLQIRDCRDCESKSCYSACDPITVDSGKDIPVSMPNDVMGFHALYIIFENVIRNTAKHGGAKDENQVCFTIEVKPCIEDKTLYEVWLYDDCNKESLLTTEDEKEDYKEITGIDTNEKTKKIDLIVARQNKSINKEILDPETNELRHGAWGMIEMKVAAAYLRKIPVETVDDLEYQVQLDKLDQLYTEHKVNGQDKKIPNILKAVNKDGCLGYVFHIMKPKELLVIDETGNLYKELIKIDNTGKKIKGKNKEGSDKTKLDRLKEYGIWVLNTDEKSPDCLDENGVYPHPFLLVIPNKKGFNVEKYLKNNGLYRGNLPTRILVQGKVPEDGEENAWVAWLDDSYSLTKQLNPESIDSEFKSALEEIWKYWIKHKLDYLEINGLGSWQVDNINPMTVFTDYFNTKVLCSTEPDNPDFNIFLEHHGQNIHKAFNAEQCLFDHFEAYSSVVNRFLEKAKKEKVTNCQLMDGILSNILIIDERIQAIYQEDFRPAGANSFSDMEKRMKAANIHIPKVADIDLNQSSYNPNDDCTLHQIIEDLKSSSSLKKGIDFIIIHLGVIERILEAKNQQKGKSEIKSFIVYLTKISDARVVITSGRGKPDNLPDEVPFMSYSALSHYAIENPFKSLINQAGQSSRMFNKNE